MRSKNYANIEAFMEDLVFTLKQWCSLFFVVSIL